MKLLVVSHSFASPINQQFYAEVERQTGWAVTLVVPSNWRDEYGGRLTPRRWPVFAGELVGLPVWRPGSIVLHAYRASLARLFRRHAPDVIYAHNEPYSLSAAQAYAANRASGDRPIGFYAAQNIVKRYPLPFRLAERFVHRHSRFAFPVTADVERALRSRGYAGPCTVLPLGYDPGVYRPAADRDAIRHGLLRPGESVLIGYVGRMVEAKGLATLARALPLIDSPAWRLVVVGSGPFDPPFDRLARDLGVSDRVTRVGFVPHERVPAYFSACDMVTVPSETQDSWKEQFGRVIVESLACGTAVVGSDSGEIPNLIRQTGGGLVFAERDPATLAGAMRRLIDDAALRADLARAGRLAVAERFANPSLATRFAQTLDRVHAAAAEPVKHA